MQTPQDEYANYPMPSQSDVVEVDCGEQIASYLGLVPPEESSGDRRRLGHISKQGNSVLRFLWLEAAPVTVRSNQKWRSKFFHLAMRRGGKIAKVASAPRLAIRLYGPLRPTARETL
jgi:transposase